jgi:hypothetical protein
MIENVSTSVVIVAIKSKIKSYFLAMLLNILTLQHNVNERGKMHYATYWKKWRRWQSRLLLVHPDRDGTR